MPNPASDKLMESKKAMLGGYLAAILLEDVNEGGSMIDSAGIIWDQDHLIAAVRIKTKGEQFDLTLTPVIQNEDSKQ